MSLINDNNQSQNLAVQEARDKAKIACQELSRHILGILPTLTASLDRMSDLLEDLKLEASVELFQDFGKGVQSLNNSLQTAFFENDDIEKITPLLTDVFARISSLIEKYEAKDITAIKNCLAAELSPSFQLFRKELELTLHKAFPVI